MTVSLRHARLIDSLAEDLTPVRRLPSPGLRALRWLVLVVLFGLLLTWWSDLAALRDRVAARPEVGLAMAGSALTAALAAWAAFQSAIPGSSRRWRLLPLLALLLWVGASGLGCFGQAVSITSRPASVQAAMDECLPFIVLVSLPLSGVLMVMLRRGFATHPDRTGALAGLAAAAGAATLLNLFHPFDVAAIDLTVHALAVALVCLAGWACGRWLPRG
jgi:hypothetical protein